MTPKYKLRIKNGDLNGTTGHHTIQVHVREFRDDDTVVDGVPETFGIEPDALQRKFGGDIKAWRQWVGKEMVKRHKIRMLAHAEVLNWSGRDFDIEENE